MANNIYGNQPYQPYGYQMINQQNLRYAQSPFEPQYVTGIEGANAYQMPVGVSQMILWDTDRDCFYIKKLDEIGRPRVVAWKDFQDHVEPVPAQTADTAQAQVDMSVYPTKKDLEDMLEKYNMTQYLTKEEFESTLKQLCVGERGRIVRNELNT